MTAAAGPETRPEPSLFAVTCETGDCPESFQGHGSYQDAWQDAWAAGWRTDLSGLRHCPACVAERAPSRVLYLMASRRAGMGTVSADGFLDDLETLDAARFEIRELPPLPPVLDELFRPADDAVQADAQAALARWTRGDTIGFPAIPPVAEDAAGEPVLPAPAEPLAVPAESPAAITGAADAARDWDSLRDQCGHTAEIPAAIAETEIFERPEGMTA